MRKESSAVSSSISMDSSTSGFLAMFAGIWIFVMLISVAIYVVSSLGYYKLYKKLGAENAWMAWVPFFNIYAQAEFLQVETESPEWMKWCMGFYWAANVIPILGQIASFAGFVLVIVNECKYISKHGGQVPQYILVFVFPIILPYLWIKNYQ